MDRPELVNLPAEITASILGYLRRPTDMISLCLTCKRLHEITVYQLYQTVTIKVGFKETTNRILGQFLNPSNIGLQHVKVLDLSLGWETKDKSKTQRTKIDREIRRILKALPENNLDEFRWGHWDSLVLAVETIVLLYKKQKDMKSVLTPVYLGADVVGKLQEIPKFETRFQDVRSVTFLPSQGTLDIGGMILHNAPKIQHLTIVGATSGWWGRSVSQPQVLDTLVSLYDASHKRPLALKKLMFSRVDLAGHGARYGEVIDFQTLESLCLWRSCGVHDYLPRLITNPELPHKINRFELKQVEPDSQWLMGALDSFLSMASGIHTLYIDLRADRLPVEAGIIRQAKSLKELLIHVRAGSSPRVKCLPYGGETRSKICKECPLLEQISLPLPLNRQARCHPRTSTYDKKTFCKLPELVALQVASWPLYPALESHDIRNLGKVYIAYLQNIVQTCFEQNVKSAEDEGRRPKLTVVAFGILSEQNDLTRTPVFPVIFGKGKQIDLFGGEKMSAVRIPWPQYRNAGTGSESTRNVLYYDIFQGQPSPYSTS